MVHRTHVFIFLWITVHLRSLDAAEAFSLVWSEDVCLLGSNAAVLSLMLSVTRCVLPHIVFLACDSASRDMRQAFHWTRTQTNRLNTFSFWLAHLLLLYKSSLSMVRPCSMCGAVYLQDCRLAESAQSPFLKSVLSSVFSLKGYNISGGRYTEI